MTDFLPPQTLDKCPSSPNCVCSCEAIDNSHYVSPLELKYDNSLTNIINKIASIISTIPRTTIITQTDSYLKVEFRTYLGFVDDVEILLKPGRQIIEFRSASRLGYYDFGKNLSRYVKIKKELSGLLK